MGMAGARGRGAMWVLGCRCFCVLVGVSSGHRGDVERRDATPLRWVAGPSAPPLFLKGPGPWVSGLLLGVVERPRALNPNSLIP